jgi:hypothetical protein
MVFVRGEFLGGCDDTKALYRDGTLEQRYLVGLVQVKRTVGTDKLETAQLLPKERSVAMNPPLWFPNTVNNNVIRATGVQVCIISTISAALHWKVWARWLAVGLLVDFLLRFMAGAGCSPIGMISTFITSPMKPDFRPGPPKQFASFCGVFFALMGTIFYFVDFSGHDIVGACFIGGLAGAAGLEGFADFCLYVCIVCLSCLLLASTVCGATCNGLFTHRSSFLLFVFFRQWMPLLRIWDSVWIDSELDLSDSHGYPPGDNR